MPKPVDAESHAGSETLLDARSPAPAPGQPRSRNIRALTSVRFFAALYVALFHMVRPFEQWGRLSGFVTAGYTGVSFFFLLSGYILTYSHAHEPEVGPEFRKRFYFARFARIYPVYLLLTLAAAYLDRAQFAKHIHIAAFVADLAMVQTWSARMVSFFNVPAWSVATEVFFYAVFPFVLLKLRPRTRARGVMAIAVFWLLAMVMPVVALIFYPAGAWHQEEGFFAFWVRRFPPFALPEFLAGVSLGWIFLRFRPGRRAASVMSIAGLLALLVTLYFADHLPSLMLCNGLLIPLYALVLLGLSEDTLLARMLSGAPLVLLGEASYALYLTHFLFNDWVARFGIGGTIRDACWKLAMVIPLSIVLHLTVERPSRRALLRWWNRRHGTAVAGAAS